VPQLVEAVVRVRPVGEVPEPVSRQLGDLGPTLIERIRALLHPEQENRLHERWPCTLPLHVYPLTGEGIGPRLEGLVRDLSLNAVGFCLAEDLPGERAYLVPARAELANFALLAQVQRRRKLGDGSFEIGANFGAG
jgi:hypothetical protein